MDKALTIIAIILMGLSITSVFCVDSMFEDEDYLKRRHKTRRCWEIVLATWSIFSLIVGLLNVESVMAKITIAIFSIISILFSLANIIFLSEAKRVHDIYQQVFNKREVTLSKIFDYEIVNGLLKETGNNKICNRVKKTTFNDSLSLKFEDGNNTIVLIPKKAISDITADYYCYELSKLSKKKLKDYSEKVRIYTSDALIKQWKLDEHDGDPTKLFFLCEKCVNYVKKHKVAFFYIVTAIYLAVMISLSICMSKGIV